VDAGRLARAQEAGLLLPVRSATLDGRIPAHLRDPEGHWYGFSMRARVVMYDRAQGLPAGLARYEDLARPEFRGMVSTRSSSNIYSIGWTASVLAANGPEATEAWARGIAANLARPPHGGDRDQFRALPSGQCRIAVSNTYYLGHVGRSDRPEDRALFERIGVIFPNQGAGDRGTHVNVSGAALVRTAPNAAAARRFLEFLVSDQAQEILAQGNMEYPAVPGAPMHPLLRAMGEFRAEGIEPLRDPARATQALQIMQRAGWR